MIPFRSSKRCSALALTLALLTGCENPFAGDYLCPDDRSPAIEVEIRDARTGAPVAQDARGAVHDGAYIDSLKPSGGTGPDPFVLVSRSAAEERPGTYLVEVTHAGYQPWTMGGVRVGAGRCGVRTRRLTASLEPL